MTDYVRGLIHGLLFAWPWSFSSVARWVLCIAHEWSAHELSTEAQDMPNPPSQQRLTAERAQAMHLLAELSPKTAEQKLLLVRNSPRFATWGFCTLVLERAWQYRMENAPLTLELAEIAKSTADNLSPARYGDETVNNLRAAACAYVGNAYRIASDYPSAHRAFLLAEAHLERGGDAATRALVLHLKASLVNTQGDHEQALLLLDKALGLYRAIHDTQGVGTVFTKKGLIFSEQGIFPTAKYHFRTAVFLLDPDIDISSFLAAQQNLVVAYQECGELDNALLCLQEYQYLHEGHDILRVNRLRWLEARIYKQQQKFELATIAFQEARHIFLDQNILFDAAQVSLELALLYLEQGATMEFENLAAELVPIFESQDMHYYAALALRTFHEAARARRASVALTERVLFFLERARDDPRLPFEP